MSTLVEKVEALETLVAAVRDWVEYGAADGSREAEVRSQELLERIARDYAEYVRLGGAVS